MESFGQIHIPEQLMKESLVGNQLALFCLEKVIKVCVFCVWLWV